MKPRPKAEASECLRDALFSTEVTWKNQNYTRKNFSEECKARTIISTECFFGLSGLFEELEHFFPNLVKTEKILEKKKFEYRKILKNE